MYKKLTGLLMAATITAHAAQFSVKTSFKDGEPIDVVHSLDGGNKAPDLSWENVPKGTESFALIVDDPDAPTKTPWVHWVVYTIPGTQTSLSKPLGRKAELSDGILQGINTFKKIGYDGPRPPRGEKHRYFFKLYALDSKLALPGGKSKEEVETAMKGHILGEAQIIGTFKRS